MQQLTNEVTKTVKTQRLLNPFTRDLQAPHDLPVPFFPLRAPLLEMDRYESTGFWLSGMKKATRKAYVTHLRLFCRFYSTDPDILVRFPAEHLRILLDAYLRHLLKVAEKEAGKPKVGRFSVNSVGHYFTGLRSFFVDEHEKDINWVRYEKKFPEKVGSNLRGYYREEVQKLYKAADIYDKPLVLLEYCTFVRVGAIGPARFEHLVAVPELPGFYFLKVYAESANEFYYVVLTPEFMGDIENLKQYRQRSGEKITPKSYLLCQKSRRMWGSPLSEDTIRERMRRLAAKAGVDLSNIQPNHGMRKAGNTAMKNAHVDKDFKEMLMGHSTGLDDTYYDVENPESRREIAMEYMKAADSLTISDESKLRRELEKANEELRNVPTIKQIQVELEETKKKLTSAEEIKQELRKEMEKEFEVHFRKYLGLKQAFPGEKLGQKLPVDKWFSKSSSPSAYSS